MDDGLDVHGGGPTAAAAAVVDAAEDRAAALLLLPRFQQINFLVERANSVGVHFVDSFQKFESVAGSLHLGIQKLETLVLFSPVGESQKVWFGKEWRLCLEMYN